jgi:NTE family protein/lysophospholipid hydrolase
LQSHHHVRRGNQADMARVARFLAGVPVGLVLGGGGVRGLAHVGVMRALNQAGVAVDMIGGTSIGAVVGVQFALGRSPERILRETQQAFTGLLDYTLPAVALAAGGRLSSSLRAALGEMQFEDTWLPYFCVASNLTRAEVAVLDHGTLWRAVRASCGLPGVFPPVGIEGDLLVDGCLLNNLPVDIMAKRCAGPIIAVDATPTVDLEAQGWRGDAMSGFRHLANRINPLGSGSDLPGIARILQRACELSSVRAHRARLRDVNRGLLLTPAVGGIPTLDFGQAEQAVEAGYRAACEALPGWLAGAS